MSTIGLGTFVRPLFACFVLLWTAPGGAQEGRKSDFSDAVTLHEVDAAERRIVVEEDGKRTTLYADEGTKVLDGARNVPLADLEVGDRLAIDATYESPEKTGKLIVNRIVVVREPVPAR